MKPSIRLTAVRTLCLGLLALLLGACGDEQETSPTAESETPSTPVPAPQTAYLMAAAGEVEISDAVSGLDVGDSLFHNQTVNVAADSFADLQFGDRVRARLFGVASATVILVNDQSHSHMGLLLEQGSVAVSVD